MTERFNSGQGGYTCDMCNVLLWSGYRGSLEPLNRKFCYGSTPESIVKKDSCFYCESCAIRLNICRQLLYGEEPLKHCPKCNITKNLNEFGLAKNRADRIAGLLQIL